VKFVPVRSVPRLHVNRRVITSNRKNGKSEPVFRLKVGNKNYTAHRVVLSGQWEAAYRPEKPLSCGAVAWMECKFGAAALDDETVIEFYPRSILSYREANSTDAR